MKNFIAITVFSSDLDGLTHVLNRIICTPIKKDIFLFDVTEKGVNSEIKALIRSYNRFGVFIIRVKAAAKTNNINRRINMGIAESMLRFNSFKGHKYVCYTHIYQNMEFQGFDLQILIGNAGLFNAISPIVESLDGIEIITAVFDRWGSESFKLAGEVTHHITGAVEESFTLNPKCFSMSSRYIGKIINFTYSNDDPISFLNAMMYNYAVALPNIDTNIFVHENLY